MTKRQRARKFAFSAIVSIIALPAWADWHSGAITGLHVGYDGTTIMFDMAGFVRSNCTCYSPWPNYMCLDRSRVSFREEFAMMETARLTGVTMNVNIDEVTCKVLAMYEIG
jgi:hypothetical protein